MAIKSRLPEMDYDDDQCNLIQKPEGALAVSPALPSDRDHLFGVYRTGFLDTILL